jgi:DNA-binding NarL/FixJ family response regulator
MLQEVDSHPFNEPAGHDGTGVHPSYRIMVAEDHELARYGLCLALEEKCGMQIVAEAEQGQQALDLIAEKNPEVVLMDIGMPVMDGISATKELKQKYPQVKVVMLTSHKDQEEIFAAIAAGADAYCLKDVKIERLCTVIEMVMEGAVYMDPAIAKIIMSALPGSASENSEKNLAPSKPTESVEGQPHPRKRYNTDLTERELEVLGLIVDGKSNKEIAVALEVTVHTAKAHVCNIIQKLAVDDRTQVAVKALKEGLLQ